MKATRELKEVKVKTVEKTLSLLELLAEQNVPLSLTRIAQLASLSISTAYRLLNTLCRSGFVERDPLTGHYKLGIKAFLIGNSALGKVELRNVALPYLTELSKGCKTSVYLSILSGQSIFYSDCVKTDNPIQIGIQTGIPISAPQTGSGKVLLAYLPLQRQLELIEIYTQNALLQDNQTFLKELALIQKQGYSISTGDFWGFIREFSAPIFDHTHRPVGAVSIFEPDNRGSLTEEDQKRINLLRETTAKISKALGCPILSGL